MHKNRFRLLTILVTLCFAMTTFAQAPKISLHLTNASLMQFVKAVENQTSYTFMFDNSMLLDHQINLNVNQESLPVILKKAFEGNNVTYTISKQQIILKSKVGLSQKNTQHQRVISGVVTDNLGEPVIGANVIIEGTTVGLITDLDGRFEIKTDAKNPVLVFSFIGMKKQRVVVGNRQRLDVKMKIDAQALDEVVVVGFGVQKKENLTGSVSQVKMEDVLGDRPIINMASALQGAMPGLQVTGGATPGASMSFNIRGTLSINGGEPLVLIDNVEGDPSLLNPEDIQSVTVLKDAASAAIYGSRAAGGVILITTKHPDKKQDFKLNYNNNFGFQESINRPKQASLLDYLQGYLDAGFSDKYWANSQSVSKWIEYEKAYKQDPSQFDTVGDGIYVDPNDDVYYLNEKDVYAGMLETGTIQTHNISAQGGTDHLRYRMSGSYNYTDGPLYLSKDTYRRVNVGAFVSADVNEWFTQEVNISLNRGKSTIAKDEMGSLYTQGMISFTPEGIFPASANQLSDEDLPVRTPKSVLENSNVATTETYNPRVFLKSIIKPFKGFTGVLEYTFDRNSDSYNYFTGKWYYTTIQMGKSASRTTDYYVKNKSFTNYNALNVYGTYKYDLKDHHFKLMAGFNQESSRYENLTTYAEDQSVISVPSFVGSTGLVTNTDSYTDVSLRGGFYRFNYDYKNRYLFETNGRYDGSSKFPKSNRFGFFPSVSLGWQVAEEAFMEDSRGWLDMLKLRASWGQIGNQNISAYQYTPSMDIYEYKSWLSNEKYPTAIGTPGLVSSNFTWETVETLDFGFDLSSFSNRLSLTFDWYQRTTRDMLSAGVELPALVGTSAPLQNVADMRTRGWEVSLNWRDHVGDFSYNVGINLYDHKSEITKYNNESGLLSDYYVGKDFGSIWGYKTDGYYTVDDFEDTTSWKLKEGVTSIKGVNVRPGDLKFKNLKDDENSINQIDPGNSTLENPGDRVIIGNSSLRYQFGVNLGASYKGFALNVMLQGTGKRDVWISGLGMFPFGGMFGALSYNTTDYWKPVDIENGDYTAVKDNPEYFRVYGQLENASSNKRTSDKYLQNAAYLRVKNVALSYTLDKSLFGNLPISAVKLFSNIENLTTFTSLPKGYDPERISWGYPFYRTISFGANITF